MDTNERAIILEKSLQFLCDAFDQFLTKGPKTFPISSLPYTKEQIEKAIKEEIAYDNKIGKVEPIKNEKMEKGYPFLSNFIKDGDVWFMNEVDDKLAADMDMSQGTHKEIVNHLDKLVGYENYKRYEDVETLITNERYTRKKEIRELLGIPSDPISLI
jgi:hypothetical protein